MHYGVMSRSIINIYCLLARSDILFCSNDAIPILYYNEIVYNPIALSEDNINIDTTV